MREGDSSCEVLCATTESDAEALGDIIRVTHLWVLHMHEGESKQIELKEVELRRPGKIMKKAFLLAVGR